MDTKSSTQNYEDERERLSIMESGPPEPEPQALSQPQALSPSKYSSPARPRGREGALPKFARSELTLGPMVGKGGFSLVFEISSIDVDEVYDISKRSASERREVAGDSLDMDGRPRYAVKMLRDDLMDEEHSKGVIDLAVEARFLRRLLHPNIVAMV